MSIDKNQAPSRPPSARNWSLLVFDWDGTIVDSVAGIAACAQHALRELGWPVPSTAAIGDAVGLGLVEILERFRPGATAEERNLLVKTYRHHWFATYRHRSAAIPGIADTLAQLEAEGYLLAVATGKSRAGLEQDLETTGLHTRFVATRTVDEAPSKPSPEMLFDLLRELGIDAAEALMIGDTTHDLGMARNAGVAAIGVLTGPHDAEAMAPFAPLDCLRSAAELPAWLGRS